LAKAGTLAIIGVYPPTLKRLPIARGDEQEPHHQVRQMPSPQVQPEFLDLIFDEPVYYDARDFPYLWEEMRLPISY
jgi:hypothetical protein